MNSNSRDSMKMHVPGAKQAIDKMKYEIASELGIHLGADTSSRLNGTVGGEMTKRLIENENEENAQIGSALMIYNGLVNKVMILQKVLMN